MKDSHLTSSLQREPFRQYRVSELEETDITEVGPELQFVMGYRYEHRDYEVYEDLFRSGGRIAIAARLTAVEAPHGPDDLEIEAAAVLSPNGMVPIVYRRDPDTPDELVRYMDGYLSADRAPDDGSSLQRLPRARELREVPRTYSPS